MNNLNVDDSALFFNKVFRLAYEKGFPLKKVPSNISKKCLPFFDKNLDALRNIKNCSYRKYKLYPTQENLNTYKDNRNIYISSLRKTKKEYIFKEVEKLKTNPKQLWQFIGENTGLTNASKKANAKIEFLNIDSTIIDSTLEIANEFCDYYANVGKNLANNVPKYEKNYDQFLKNRNINSFWIEPFNILEIAETTEKLNVKRTPDLFNVSNYLLKKVACEIAIPLHIIFNKSIMSGIFPSSWKASKIIPIYKGTGPLTNMNNFRPIAQIIGFTKIFEKCMLNRLSTFIEKNNVLSPYQFGYRKGFTVQQSIVKFLNFCAENNTQNRYYSSILVDCSKAFDSIDRNILLYKLERIGIRGQLLNWFESYMSDRTIQVEINDITSTSINSSDYGVLQGSALSALLFIIYVNDMNTSVPNTLCLQYADDANICCSASNQRELISQVESCLCNLTKWFDANIITINLEKTEYVVFKKDNETSSNINSFLDGRNTFWKIEMNNNPVRYLGFWFDSKLNFLVFFEKIIRKMQFGVFILSRIKNFYPENIKIQLFNCFVQSHLEFSAIFYHLAPKKIRNQFFSLQKRGLRFVKCTKTKIHSKQLFMLYNVLPIEILSKLRIFQFMQRIIRQNKLNYFSPDWVLKKDVYKDRPLRNTHHLAIPFVHTEKMRNMPYVTFPLVYNELIDVYNSIEIDKKISCLREKLLKTFNDYNQCITQKCKMCKELNFEIKCAENKKSEKILRLNIKRR